MTIITVLKSILWEPAAARALVLAVIAGGGVWVAQPTGRTWLERLLYAAPVALATAGASVPSSTKPPGE